MALGGIEYDRATSTVTDLVLLGGRDAFDARVVWIEAAPAGRVRTPAPARVVLHLERRRLRGRLRGWRL